VTFNLPAAVFLYLLLTCLGYNQSSGGGMKGGGEMKRLIESIQTFGHVLGVVLGSNFTGPRDKAFEQYRYLRYDF
jgi:hypothetical protein